MARLRVAYDPLPVARWGPLFHVLCLEVPDLRLEWQPVAFPTIERPLLDRADVGLFVGPRRAEGVDAVALESSNMAVAMAAGHPLARQHELRVADVLDQTFPGAPAADPDWRAFWTLDEQRGGPAQQTDDDVRNPEQGLEVVASGRAIATIPATIALGLPHPGIVAIPLTDGPQVTTSLFWHSGDEHPIVRRLASLAWDMIGARGSDEP